MREEIARQFYIRTREGPKPLAWGREAFHDTLSALLHYRERDPFLDYLDELPLWDGLARVEGLLCNMFGAAWSPLAEWASLFMFLGVVQRTFEPGCKLDEIPVLIGPQGIGKSALPRNAVPPDIPDLYGDGLRAEALHLYREGRRANLPRELFEAQCERAELHRDRDDLIEDAIANLPREGRYRLARIIEMLDDAAMSTAAGICTGAAAQKCTTGSVVACPRSPWEARARGDAPSARLAAARAWEGPVGPRGQAGVILTVAGGGTDFA